MYLCTKVRAETPALLTNNNYIHFVVEWRYGHITVKKDGAVMLEWKDPNPFGITHFGLRTAWGSQGHWRIIYGDSKVPQRTAGTLQQLTCPNTLSSQAVTLQCLHACWGCLS